jgi:hypothetical protein
MRTYLVSAISIALLGFACSFDPVSFDGSTGPSQTVTALIEPPSGVIAGWPTEYTFDGITGIDLGDVPTLNFTQASDFTIEGWVKINTYTADQFQFILSMNYQCSPTFQGLLIPNSGDNQGKVWFILRGSDDQAASLYSAAPLSLGAYHHIAAVRSTADRVLRLYVDGQLSSTVNDNTTADFASSVSDYLGTRSPCPDASTLNGGIKELTIYGRALTDSEIAGRAAVIVTPPVIVPPVVVPPVVVPPVVEPPLSIATLNVKVGKLVTNPTAKTDLKGYVKKAAVAAAGKNKASARGHLQGFIARTDLHWKAKRISKAARDELTANGKRLILQY